MFSYDTRPTFATAAVLFAATVTFWFTFWLDVDLGVVGPSFYFISSILLALSDTYVELGSGWGTEVWLAGLARGRRSARGYSLYKGRWL